MSSDGLNGLKLRLRDFAEVRDWDQLTCMDALMPRAHGCAGVAHSPKNLTMFPQFKYTQRGCCIKHLTNHGCSNAVGAGRTGTAQWLTEEQSKTLPQDKLDINLLKAATKKIDINEQKYPVEKSNNNANDSQLSPTPLIMTPLIYVKKNINRLLWIK